MGKDASLQTQPFEPLESQALDSRANAKDSIIGTVGSGAQNVRDNANVLEVAKERVHEAAETIKWQVGEVREGLHRRLSVDHSAVIAPELSPIPEEPPTPILMASEALPTPAEIMPPLPEEFNKIQPVELPRTTEMPQTTDMPHEKIAVIPMVSMEVDEGPAKPAPATFYDKMLAAQRSWEKSAHKVRLKIDATLEKQLGGHADKIQAEIEKARVGAIAGTARIAEFLQGKFRKAGTSMREQRQSTAAPTSSSTRQPSLPPLTPRPPRVGEQRFSGNGSAALEIKQPLDVMPHSLRVNTDDDLENQLGEERAMRNLAEGQTMRDRSLSETARVAQLLEDRLGKVASTLREQQERGLVPVYR